MIELTSPEVLLNEVRVTEEVEDLVVRTRLAIHDMLHGETDKLLIIVGPCSIHDVIGAKEYARWLYTAVEPFRSELLVIMRVYFEKPRTSLGWKGLINDPYLDHSFCIKDGLRLARQLLVDINEMGMPTGTEFLDLITPQYLTDLISWGAIGARTTESQVHRELASGSSCPVGFKNGTSGDVIIAVDAVNSAHHPHHFMGVTKSGSAAIFSTAGNKDCHIILRGGRKPNYEREYVESAVQYLRKKQLPDKVMIDCSHANSSKDYRRQGFVAASVAQQIASGCRDILGIMIESNLVPGRQDLAEGVRLQFGQSITDACIGTGDTLKILTLMAEAQRSRLAQRRCQLTPPFQSPASKDIVSCDRLR